MHRLPLNRQVARRGILLVGLTLCFPRGAAPQGTPLGPEFRVNTYTTDRQYRSSVARDPSGNFVVAWMGFTQAGTDTDIFGQRYLDSGSPIGPEFRINTDTTSSPGNPSVAADGSGNFVVVWHSSGEDGDSTGVFGQRYASSGMPVGPQFRVNSYTTGAQGFPSVAADASGNFVVIWESSDQDGSDSGIFGQRYASSGASLGAEFRVNTYTTYRQSRLSVAADSAGGFVVVWDSHLGDEPSGFKNYDIVGQRYAGSGVPLGPEFRINSYTTDYQLRPAVATDSTGNFVVVWESSFQDGPGPLVFGQRYSAAGAPVGTEFRINTSTTNADDYNPDVASDADGNFVVTWTDAQAPPPIRGIHAQRFASSGVPLGPEFRVNTFVTNYQNFSSVASDPVGNFVVTWASYGQDGSAYGVFGQRYSPMVPVELMQLRVE